MSDGSEFNPFIPKQPVPAHPEHEHAEHHAGGSDWVVVHRGGAGSKAHVEALERKLIHAKIRARVEHDDEGRVILEVLHDDENEAKEVLGAENTHGAGSVAHESKAQHAEDEEQLHGMFATTKWKWLIWLLIVAVILLLSLWFLQYWHVFR
jgi:hypothetical protein